MKYYITSFFLMISCFCFSQERSYTIDTIQLQSGILNENRSIIIYKNQNISKFDSVKFLYLIDGEYSNYRFQKINEQFKDSVSDIIAVSIVNTNRKRDLLYIKGADKFLDFITTELMPVTEKNYLVKDRILFGHSFGGGFTVYAMINKPIFFNYYIASSPTPIMDLTDKEKYLDIDAASKSKITFYLSYGSDDLGQVRKWSDKLRNNLTGLSFNNFDWRFNVFEGKNHNNSDVAALINGLKGLK